ncbi:MAG: hypothetical protein ACI86M_001624 [Saprospiraceae bacterium]|jgi:hypothetical protein
MWKLVLKCLRSKYLYIRKPNPDFECEAASVADLAEEELIMFPNPTTGLITMKISTSEQATCTVFDMFGNLVKSITFYDTDIIDLSELKSSVYFVKVKFENREVIKKIVISQ